jgi:hypothetical protein
MKTVNIKPAVAFANSKRMIATSLNVESKFDNLFDHVVFKYTLFDEQGQHAGEGGHELRTRDEYVTWDASAEGAFKIVADALELEIVPSVGGAMFAEV